MLLLQCQLCERRAATRESEPYIRQACTSMLFVTADQTSRWGAEVDIWCSVDRLF
jgi:hypothetical protein